MPLDDSDFLNAEQSQNGVDDEHSKGERIRDSGCASIDLSAEQNNIDGASVRNEDVAGGDSLLDKMADSEGSDPLPHQAISASHQPSFSGTHDNDEQDSMNGSSVENGVSTRGEHMDEINPGEDFSSVTFSLQAISLAETDDNSNSWTYGNQANGHETQNFDISTPQFPNELSNDEEYVYDECSQEEISSPFFNVSLQAVSLAGLQPTNDDTALESQNSGPSTLQSRYEATFDGEDTTFHDVDDCFSQSQNDSLVLNDVAIKEENWSQHCQPLDDSEPLIENEEVNLEPLFIKQEPEDVPDDEPDEITNDDDYYIENTVFPDSPLLDHDANNFPFDSVSNPPNESPNDITSIKIEAEPEDSFLHHENPLFRREPSASRSSDGDSGCISDFDQIHIAEYRSVERPKKTNDIVPDGYNVRVKLVRIDEYIANEEEKFETDLRLDNIFSLVKEESRRGTFTSTWAICRTFTVQYDCMVCRATFRRKMNFVEHLKEHAGDKAFECDICHKRMSSYKSLMSHGKYHLDQNEIVEKTSNSTTTTNKCRFCSKKFNDEIALNFHLRKAHKYRVYKCNVCETEYKSSSSLEAHLLTHLGISLEPSENVGKGIEKTDDRALRSLRDSTPSKSNTCLVCQKVFPSYRRLFVHSKTHIALKAESTRHTRLQTILRSYETCEMEYFEEDDEEFALKVDLIDNTEVYRCAVCYLLFHQKELLVKHLTSHEDDSKSSDVDDESHFDSNRDDLEWIETGDESEGIDDDQVIETATKDGQSKDVVSLNLTVQKSSKSPNGDANILYNMLSEEEELKKRMIRQSAIGSFSYRGYATYEKFNLDPDDRRNDDKLARNQVNVQSLQHDDKLTEYASKTKNSEFDNRSKSRNPVSSEKASETEANIHIEHGTENADSNKAKNKSSRESINAELSTLIVSALEDDLQSRRKADENHSNRGICQDSPMDIEDNDCPMVIDETKLYNSNAMSENEKFDKLSSESMNISSTSSLNTAPRPDFKLPLRNLIGNTYTGSLTCTVCQKRYSKKSDLVKHRKIHKGLTGNKIARRTSAKKKPLRTDKSREIASLSPNTFLKEKENLHAKLDSSGAFSSGVTIDIAKNVNAASEHSMERESSGQVRNPFQKLNAANIRSKNAGSVKTTYVQSTIEASFKNMGKKLKLADAKLANATKTFPDATRTDLETDKTPHIIDEEQDRDVKLVYVKLNSSDDSTKGSDRRTRIEEPAEEAANSGEIKERREGDFVSGKMKKLLQCSFCPKQWKDKTGLIMHLRTHTGERPFQCTFCQRRYTQRSALNFHWRKFKSHAVKRVSATANENYEMSKGNTKKVNIASASSKKDIAAERDKHFSCSVCSKRWINNSQLIKHMRSHTGERPYKCSICQRHFSQISNLNYHLRIKHAESVKKESPKSSANERGIEDLNLDNSNDEAIIVRRAQLNANTNGVSSAITENKSSTKGGSKCFACSICSKRWRCESHLIIHMRAHTGERPFQCTFCQRRFTQRSSLYLHWRKFKSHAVKRVSATANENYEMSKGNTEKVNIASASSKRDIAAERNKRFSCSVCSKRWRSNYHLIRHMTSHRGERPYKCSICEHQFWHISDLNFHLRIKHAESVKKESPKSSANERGIEDLNLDTLNDKAIIVTRAQSNANTNGVSRASTENKSSTKGGSKRFQCSICSKRWRYESYLITHMRAHTGERPFQCTFCQRHFRQISHLNLHVREFHAGDEIKKSVTCSTNQVNSKTGKRYECSVCSKRWSCNADLIKHMRTHTGEKPYHCKFCKRRFSQKSTLKTHLRVVHGEYSKNASDASIADEGGSDAGKMKGFSCHLCPKRWQSALQLAIHMRTHTKQKPYYCNLCKRTFTQLSSLNFHLRNNKSHADSTSIKESPASTIDAERVDLIDYSNAKISEIPAKLNSDVAREKSCEKGTVSSLERKLRPRNEALSEVIIIHDDLASSDEANGEKQEDPLRSTTDISAEKIAKQRGITERKLRHRNETLYGTSATMMISDDEFAKSSDAMKSDEKATTRPSPKKTMNQAESESQLGPQNEVRKKILPRELRILPELYICSICGTRCRSARDFKKHKSLHAGIMRYKCKLCKVRFSKSSTYRAHVQEHHSQTSTELKSDIPKSTKNQCKVCNKVIMGSKTHLILHMRVHTNERPFQCDVCRKRFKQMYHLKRHMLMNTAKNPFQCTQIEDRFLPKSSIHSVAKSDLTKSKEKRKNQCTVCHKVIESYSHLMIHMRVHTGERPFKCSVCKKRFKQIQHLKKHMLLNTAKNPFRCTQTKVRVQSNTSEMKPFQCLLCEDGFYTSSQLNEHLQTHSEKGPFPCNICRWKSSSVSQLILHMRRHEEERPYKCSMCPKRYIFSSNLNRHKNASHKGLKAIQCSLGRDKQTNLSEEMPTAQSTCEESSKKANLDEQRKVFTLRTLECSRCKESFRKKPDFDEHSRKCKGEERERMRTQRMETCQNSSQTESDSDVLIEKETDGSPYQSTVRNSASNTSSVIQIKSHESRTCTYCAKLFMRREDMKKHMQVCVKKSQINSNLKTHPTAHSDGRRYPCAICKIVCASRSDLIAHLRTHEMKKCDYCARLFSRENDVKKHMTICRESPRVGSNLNSQARTLSGGRRYPCTVCPRVCVTTSGLVNHMRIHTNEKPFKCALCARSFNQACNMRAHMKCCRGINPPRPSSNLCGRRCTICKKLLSSPLSLKMHMKTHSSYRPYECSMCSFRFKRKHNLNRHMKICLKKSSL